MSYSLNEVEATVTKAARGAGLAWGFAAEGGRAARWLVSQGLDGCAVARAALDDIPGTDSPILTGAWCVDHARVLAPETRSEAPLRGALMMLAFAAQVARLRRGRSVGVLLPDGLWCTDGTRLSGPAEPMDIRAAAPVTVQLDAPMGPLRPQTTRATPRPEDWTALLALAARTYAPATEASRALGAGSGAATDND